MFNYIKLYYIYCPPPVISLTKPRNPMYRLLQQAICAAFLLLNVYSSSAQVNSIAYQQRQSDLIDSSLITSNFNAEALVFQVYRGLPIDTPALNNWISNIPTKSTLDFEIVKMIRMLYLSNGEYDNWIYSSIDTLPFWVNKADTLYGYWSENHMIQWMSSEWLLHEKFNRPTSPNLEQRVNHYLDLKLEYGFYEFFSTTYAPYSFGGIMNLADFAQDPTIKNKAIAVAQRLIGEILLVANDQGTYFPAAGRNYYGSYDRAYGHNIQSIIYLVTGNGVSPNRAQHASAFLATSDLYIEDVVANTPAQVDTLYSIGHPIDSSQVIHAGYTDVDRLMFQWSFGGYFPPQFAYESATLINDSLLWGHVDFEPFKDFRSFTPSQIQDIATALDNISTSTVICEQDLKIFRQRSVTLASIQDFHAGKAGFQQFPCVANIGRSAIMTASGEFQLPWRNRNSNNANEHLPYVEQLHNVALLMYWPEGENILLKDPLVTLHLEQSEMDEIVEDSLWIMLRQDNNYVAIRRSCMDMNSGYYACPTEPIQSWAIVVGDSIMYDSFSNFQSLVSNAVFTESLSYNETTAKNEYYASVSFDTMNIDHTWERDSLTVGIDVVELNDNAVKVYPNPAYQQFTIELDEQFTSANIRIMDITGREVYRTDMPNNNRIQVDMADRNSGMYLIQIQHSNGTITKKLLKH